MRRPRPSGITHAVLVATLYGAACFAYLRVADTVLHTDRFLSQMGLATFFFAPAALIHAWLNRVIRDRGAAV